MGYYIEVPNNHHKAKQIVDIYKAELVLSPETFGFNGPDALICVVENGLFDAAGVAYDEKERDAFLPNIRDTRPRVWLKLSKEKVLELQPRLKHVWAV